MDVREYDLPGILSGLLKTIEDGREKLAHSEVHEKFWSVVRNRDRVQDKLQHTFPADTEPGRSEALAELARLQSEFDALNDEATALWRTGEEICAFIVPFVNEVDLLADRLPAAPEWNFYRKEIKGRRIGDAVAWLDPRRNPDLETLELRLKEMYELAGGKQTAGTLPGLSHRSQRGPNLETSRERVELEDLLRSELTTVVLEQRKFTTIEALRKKFPDFRLWELLSEPEQESLPREELKPRHYAAQLVLRKYALTSEETLKKDRKKIRKAARPDTELPISE